MIPNFNKVTCLYLRVVFSHLRGHRCLYFSYYCHLRSDTGNIETVALQGVMGIYHAYPE